MKHRTQLEEELIDTICDDADDLVDFMQARIGMENEMSNRISEMSEEEFRNTWNQYITYQTIDDAIAEIEWDEP